MAEAERKACTSQKTNPLFTKLSIIYLFIYQTTLVVGQAKQVKKWEFLEQQGSEECQHLQKEYKNYISQNCDTVRLPCFIRNVHMVKQ